MALFGFGRPRPEDEARRRVERRVHELLARQSVAEGVDALDRDTVIKANEIVCADPACPGVETVILLLGTGRKSIAFKIPKPLSEVTQADLADALDGGN